jgi:hypothetical protein
MAITEVFGGHPTGLVGEITAIPFSAHLEYDYNPSCAGAVPVPEPGPSDEAEYCAAGTGRPGRGIVISARFFM